MWLLRSWSRSSSRRSRPYAATNSYCPKEAARGRLATSAQLVPRGMSATGIITDTLAAMLTRPVGRPVLNRTKIEGSFNIDLSYADPRVPGSDTTELPSVFTAVQEQLALKLESQKVPLRILVIDRCEHVLRCRLCLSLQRWRLRHPAIFLDARGKREKAARV
ncbi:MAG: hypothetical protein JWN34_5138 [Bryobacterales bacterium]|nr:hypothetical protein [Bryobacterales bacterium]